MNLVTGFKADNAPHILISAPGGHGKSAMLRELVKQYINHYSSSKNSPIPVYMNVTGKSFEGSILDELQSHLKSYTDKKMLEVDVRNGSYIIMLDGLSESEIDTKIISDFVDARNDLGKNTVLIATIRDNKAYEKAFAQSDNFIKVVPQKLDDTNIAKFEQNYLGAGHNLEQNVRAICRDQKGNYLPILVRLAILYSGQSSEFKPSTVNELYAEVVRSLTKLNYISDDLVDISTQSYFNKGRREVFLIQSNEEIINIVRDSGLLIPLNGFHDHSATATKYKFLHDSIQSFLVAYGIFQKYDNDDQSFDLTELFFDLATKDIYTKDQSSVIFNAGSELFQMTVIEFENKGYDLTSLFKKQISEYVEEYANDISVNALLNSLPDTFSRQGFMKIDTPIELNKSILQMCDSLYLTSEYYNNLALLIKKIRDAED